MVIAMSSTACSSCVVLSLSLSVREARNVEARRRVGALVRWCVFCVLCIVCIMCVFVPPHIAPADRGGADQGGGEDVSGGVGAFCHCFSRV